ncbi:hypothetical protein D9619_012449 [Psilocybe cf. subviscida]|uniref:Uncharacterized protein n=1 Tax=Psilocybe cf. subviscida TaxID=2480587 RepID=A0A8H5ARJ7_9AGAR|nr:hypothetical protein D9619_012449 [Psilocybe cf. subviscida]
MFILLGSPFNRCFSDDSGAQVTKMDARIDDIVHPLPGTQNLPSTLDPTSTITPVANLRRPSRLHQHDQDLSTSPTGPTTSPLHTSSSRYG